MKTSGRFLKNLPRLGKRVVQYVYAKDFDDYAAWLWQADILPVTSKQDFFGGSVVEAMFCDTMPLLPKRLAYPEHISEVHHEKFFYDDFDDMTFRLEMAIKSVDVLRSEDVSRFAKCYDWEAIAPYTIGPSEV